MSLNYILYRQQIEMMRAAATRCGSARAAHTELARLYMERVKQFAAAPAA